MTTHPKSEEAYRLLHDGTLAFARAEQQGMRIAIKYVLKTKKKLTKRIAKLEKEFKETKFFRQWDRTVKGKTNIYSDTQLRNFLYDIKKLEPVKTTTSGKGSTDEEALQELNIPELNILIKINKLKKIRDTYLEGFYREQVDGYIHPSFNLHLVKSYRSSANSPNFQNIPKRDKEAMKLTRDALFPRPGHQLLEIDYGQLEVRIAACYNKDKTLIHDIVNGDMHEDMASQIFMIDPFDKHIPELAYLRNATKNGFVFPQFYGDYYKNCAENMACKWGELPRGKWSKTDGVKLQEGTLGAHMISKGVKSLAHFTEHLQEIEKDFWGARYKVYDKWKDTWWEKYQEDGYVNMLTGFRCSGVMVKKKCINYPIQGAAFHCLLWSFIELDRIMVKEGWKSRLIGQIHDAIVIDTHPDELEMVIKTANRVTTQDLPKAWPWITVPLTIDAELCGVDESWANKKDFKFS